jgi:hypothetical protein
MPFTETDYFAIRTELLTEEQSVILAIEHKYMGELLDIVKSIAEDVYQDFEKAVELRPFWVNYAPRQRGRAPTDTAVPWGDMGEKTIISRLGRAIGEKYPHLTHPGVPVGGDARLATSDALIHFDIKLTGPNDNANELVASPYQISGDGSQWVNGVINSRELIKGPRAKMEFQPQLPPFYVLRGNTLLCLTYFLKAVYTVLEKGNQPLGYLELVCVPNGLLLFDGPEYAANTRMLLIPGKDDKKKQGEKRVRVRLDPLASLADWRCIKVVRTDKGWVSIPRKVSPSQAEQAE